jgi:hypothetical protein
MGNKRESLGDADAVSFYPYKNKYETIFVCREQASTVQKRGPERVGGTMLQKAGLSGNNPHTLLVSLSTHPINQSVNKNQT